MHGDEELLTAWREGDRDAGDALIGRHFASLLRFFENKVSEDAEDLAQRTLLDCVESRAMVQDGNFRAYLFGIARNRLVDHLRGKLRAGQVVNLDAISIADLGSSISHQVARGQDQRRLHEALRGIPIDHQIALELAYWEGLSGREIAEVLGIEPNTVRSRLARARDALRARLIALGVGVEEAETTLRELGDPG